MTKPLDPHSERESEKYENPIPSREFILELLNKTTAHSLVEVSASY